VLTLVVSGIKGRSLLVCKKRDLGYVKHPTVAGKSQFPVRYFFVDDFHIIAPRAGLSSRLTRPSRG
jgi:hypothetical protein